MNAITNFTAPVSFKLDLSVATADRKIEAMERASMTTVASFVDAKGKLGKAARETYGVTGRMEIARQVRNGNFRPAVERLAILSGKAIVVNKRADWDAVGYMLEMNVASLPAKYNTKGLPSGVYGVAVAAYDEYKGIVATVEAIFAKEEADKAAAQQVTE